MWPRQKNAFVDWGKRYVQDFDKEYHPNLPHYQICSTFKDTVNQFHSAISNWTGQDFASSPSFIEVSKAREGVCVCVCVEGFP